MTPCYLKIRRVMLEFVGISGLSLLGKIGRPRADGCSIVTNLPDLQTRWRYSVPRGGKTIYIHSLGNECGPELRR